MAATQAGSDTGSVGATVVVAPTVAVGAGGKPDQVVADPDSEACCIATLPAWSKLLELGLSPSDIAAEAAHWEAIAGRRNYRGEGFPWAELCGELGVPVALGECVSRATWLSWCQSCHVAIGGPPARRATCLSAHTPVPPACFRPPCAPRPHRCTTMLTHRHRHTMYHPTTCAATVCV